MNPFLFLVHSKLFNPISLKFRGFFYIIMYYIERTFTPLIYFIYPVIQEYYLKIARKEKNFAMLGKKKMGPSIRCIGQNLFYFVDLSSALRISIEICSKIIC